MFANQTKKDGWLIWPEKIRSENAGPFPERQTGNRQKNGEPVQGAF